MNTTSNSRNPGESVNAAVSERAAQYVARIHAGDLSASDEKELFAWLEQDKSHRDEYLRMLEVHDAAAALADDAELSSLIESESKVAPGSSRRRVNLAWSLAAGVALALAVSLFVGPFKSDEPRMEQSAYRTEIGEQRLVVLNEGSEIHLNTDSEIRVELSAGAREVHLIRGEAFFDVSHDPSRPFSVLASEGTATALGTEFNVMLSAAGAQVAVNEGTVALHAVSVPAAEVLAQWRNDKSSQSEGDGQVVILEDGSSATMSGQTISVTQEQDIQRFGAWRSGVLRFENRTLSSLMQELNRYTADAIEFESTEIAERTVSGVLDLRDFASVWLGLEATANVEIIQRPGRVILAARDPEHSPERDRN